MEYYYKATFTLPPELIEVIDYVKTNWGLGKAKTIQVCLENTFTLMQEEVDDPDPKPTIKKLKGTLPITVTIQYSVFKTLELYSKKLYMPMSHLVNISIKYTLMTIDESKRDLDKEIDDLMKVAEDAYCEELD